MRPTSLAPTALLPLLLILALPACDADGERNGDVSFSRTDEPVQEDDVFAILSRDEDVKLGLTEEQVYFRLSDEKRAEIEEDVAEDVDDGEGFRAVIGDAVRAGVARALRFRVAWDVDEIREIRYEDGELMFEMVDGDVADVQINVEDESVTKAFSERDARRFIREFERVKESR